MMKEIRTIIVPIDFLQHTKQIGNYALYIAGKMGAGLKFIHVIEPPHVYGDYEYASLETLNDEIAEQAEKQMKQLVDEYKNKCSDCDGKVFRGDIADCIVDYAAEKAADLIILGTHGRKGLSKMWLGSVAEQVIKRAPCPTLTCNPYKKTD